MTITLSKSIEAKLLVSFKPSTINCYKKQLTCMTLNDVTETNLKGTIKGLINKFMTTGYSNKKAYINALRNIYKCSDYDEKELDYLNSEFERICKISDGERSEKKENTQEIFHFSWSDLQDSYNTCESKYNQTGTLYDLTNWFISSLISDEQFGVKRIVDMINLTKNNIQENRIVFTAQKNGFEYESLPLSEHILKPLRLLMIANKKQTLILSKKEVKYTSTNFLYRLREVVGNNNVDSQYLRRLWASYLYSLHPTPKQLIRHAYELNHKMDVHMNDYVTEYIEDEIEIIKVCRFIKLTKWIEV